MCRLDIIHLLKLKQTKFVHDFRLFRKFLQHFLFQGGSSYHGAGGGTAYGKVDGTEFTIGSGGGGANGGAGGNFIKINVGGVSCNFNNSSCRETAKMCN